VQCEKGEKMSVQFHIEEMSNYLAVRVIHADAIEEIWRHFEWIGKFCKRTNKNKLLLDFTGAPTRIYFMERYFLGVESQDFMLYKLTKVAAVGRPEQFDKKRFGETVARNRGVNAFVFTNVEDAEEWLLKE
jgi:hypothetical protein